MVVYTSVSSYFADDLIRNSRRLALPTLALVNNWDNLNTKSFFESPPYLGVWGEQGFLIARLMHMISPHRIFVIGAPRFEIYRGVPIDRLEARRRLGWPLDKRIILFCGAGAEFEETSLLEELDDAIDSGTLKSDLHVVYKPHPLRFKRIAERPFDVTKARHVMMAYQGNRSLTELSIYPDLLAASDAIISPFSTMVMEGARHGLPALCLAYADPGHANHDWNRVAFNLHLYVIRHGDWAVVCDSRSAFIERCIALIHLIGDESAASLAKAAAEMVYRTGGKSIAARIREAVVRIAGGQDADDSYRRSFIVGASGSAVVADLKDK
jgi:hypothetical protein